MQTSCLKHPPKDKIAILRKWQIEFCDGDHCAAMLMNHFDYWHTWKLDQSKKAKKSNDIAESHGDKRVQDESLLQFHTLDDLSDVLLGLFGRAKISSALKILEEKKVISKHANPIPRYAFDKTVYYLFHPEAVNNFEFEQNKTLDVQKQIPDSSDLNYRGSEKELPSSENQRYISNKITTEITLKTAAGEEGENPELASEAEKPNFAAAASEIFIGKKLTENQKAILRSSIQKLPSNLQITKGDLFLSIESELLSENSFTHAGREFLKKLNTVLSLIKAGRWLPPAKLFEDELNKAETAEAQKQKELNTLLEKLRAAKTAKKHWEGLKGYAERNNNPAVSQYEKFIEEHGEEIKEIEAQIKNFKDGSPNSDEPVKS